MSKQIELVLTRTFAAPRDLVFKVFTEAEHLKHWWGPKGYTMEITKLDLQPGGILHYSQRSPEGQEMWGKFVYLEIVEPEKLVFKNSFSDADANTVRAPFSPTWPLEILNVWTFTEHEGETTLTGVGTPVSPTEDELTTFAAAQDMVKQGFAGTFDQLVSYLASL